MSRPRHALLASLAIVGLGGGCPDGEVVARDSDSASSGETSSSSAGSSDGSTGEPFDASRWIGRYHFENVLLPFGERGDPHGSASLTNLEILPDARATMFYDNCVFDEPILIEYEWRPSPDGWMDLLPGAGESSLRFRADPEVESLRVRLVEPCRELEVEVDGGDVGFTVVRPGEACWVDRCTTPGIMQIDYCEGEEPPPCP